LSRVSSNLAAISLVLLSACNSSSKTPEKTDSAQSPLVATDEIRYLALGDSFTIGTGIGPERAFPARLSERWRRQGQRVSLTNLATNGFTSSEVLEDQVPRLGELRPARVTLAVGANDLVRRHDQGEARRDVERLLGTRIYLDLKVKVSPGWRSDRKFLERLGL